MRLATCPASGRGAGRLLRWAALLVLAIGSPGAWTQGERVSAERPAEFMVYQYPDTLLVIRVDVPEAEFSVRTVGPEGARLKTSAAPGRRLGPVFQYIDSDDRPRQLMIEVTPSRPIGRDLIRVEVLQFRPDDPNVSRLSQAYRQYALGLEVTPADDLNSWVVKAYSLRNAAETFASMGMEEMRLWSEYFAGLLVLYRLGDFLAAVEFAGDIARAGRRAGLPALELAAAALEADARFALWEAAPPDNVDADAARLATEALERLAGLAEPAGLRSEQARALFRQGRIRERLGESDAALQRYARAEELLANSPDTELLTVVRDTSANLYEVTGRTAGALAVLDRAADEPSDAPRPDARQERARALYERGRLLNASYRHREAAESLTEALALLRSGPSPGDWGPVALELAWSRYALGEFEEAAALAGEGIPRAQGAVHATLLARSWGLLANVHRARGEMSDARRARDRQLDALSGKPGAARARLESALDRFATGPSEEREAARELEHTITEAQAEGDRVTAGLASILRCSRGVSACTVEQARAESEALVRSGLPWAAAEGRRLLAQKWAAEGQARAARLELDRLLADLHAVARLVPGVLQPWLHERMGDLGRDYLRQVAAESDAVETLLALERLRRLESVQYGPGRPAGLDLERDDALRSMFARLELARGAEAGELGLKARSELAAAQSACQACAARDWPVRGDVEAWLADLAPDEAVLAYDFSGPGVDAVLAESGRTRRVSLPAAQALRNELASFTARSTAGLPPPQLDRLGEALLAPLGRLPDRLYLLTPGPLRGLPLDGLRRGGRFLIQDHVVVQLAGLDALARRGDRMPPNYRERVFLAGNPRTGSDPFDLDLARSTEVSSLTERFVGPGLHVVQGIALQIDEFEDPRYAEATLIHLGAPGRIDLASPDRSRLRLADDVDNPDGWGLSPEQIRRLDIGAALVVLSRTGQSAPAGSVTVRVGLVQDLLDAGAARVLYSLWPAPESVATDWLLDFYAELDRGASAAEAMARAKRRAIESGSATNFQAWAGFQLFIR